MSLTDQLPDGTLVREIAELVHPDVTVQKIYDQTVLTRGNEPVQVFDDPNLPEPVVLAASTLTAVKDYIAAQIAQNDLLPVADHGPKPDLVVQVVSPTRVLVLSPIVGAQRQQFVYLQAEPMLPKLRLGDWLNMEEFHIQLLSCFVESDERTALQQFVGKLKTGLAAEIEDDGVSQAVTVMSGMTRTETVKPKNPWALAPFRTFPEVLQPECDMVLRMKTVKSGEALQCYAALHEADGGAWRMRAVTAIGAWLRGELPTGTIVLS
jgi:hypothetical protein